MAKVLILGGSGMLGHTLFTLTHEQGEHDVYATVRSKGLISRNCSALQANRIFNGADADRPESIYTVIRELRPDIIVNCIGIIKQMPEAEDAVKTIRINALFPHLIANLCEELHIRMIHISTDCVFDGRKGMYTENDPTSATDLYGRTKQLGEIVDSARVLTLRTSIIGHELKNYVSLVGWLLRQKGSINGYTQAVFSGFPTVELSRIIQRYIFPSPELHGLYHISAKPISKYELLKKVAIRYGLDVDIAPYAEFKENRSLDSSKFRRAAGYNPPQWDELIEDMYQDYQKFKRRQGDASDVYI
ncbi:SDR family oxidoreductase [Saccharibacillus sp. CPCC 101409]|uniref:dTDP-4-dehydrorhamnose reductase family protein n=1 Tax=Saccharibacillus sp. CPCC 101409 TaxID=3058041 RepID=UPI002670E043|nr:SDR family oxidoreductase [Saccharibacillus sp. CPCC 101409]MDO3412021.1 SDR family oxidoreductase [Saccharibacillus sp. CPCC 101409]